MKLTLIGDLHCERAVEMNTKMSARRGRPRKFDPDVAVAQALFHRHGYDAVSLKDLTRAMGINSPSLYAVFGSKSALFVRALELYTRRDAIPVQRILVPHRSTEQGIRTLSRRLRGGTRHITRSADASHLKTRIAGIQLYKRLRKPREPLRKGLFVHLLLSAFSWPPSEKLYA